jgi:hypothetical protein
VHCERFPGWGSGQRRRHGFARARRNLRDLRFGHQPSDRPEQRDELAARHSMTPSARASSLGICRTARAGGVHYVEQVHRHFRAGGHLPNDPHRPGRERRGRLSCPERLHVEPFHKPGTGLRGHDLECGWPMKVWKKPPISSVIYRNQLAQRRGRPLCSGFARSRTTANASLRAAGAIFDQLQGWTLGPPLPRRCFRPGDPDDSSRRGTFSQNDAIVDPEESNSRTGVSSGASTANGIPEGQ